MQRIKGMTINQHTRQTRGDQLPIGFYQDQSRGSTSTPGAGRGAQRKTGFSSQGEVSSRVRPSRSRMSSSAAERAATTSVPAADLDVVMVSFVPLARE